MKKVGLLFPGQGSQYVGMAKALTERHVTARKTFEEASDCLGWDVLRLSLNGDMAALTSTANAQPAILTHSVAAYRVWMEREEALPVVGGGHSLGEFSALACSGVIPFADAVRLVRHRGELMQAAAGTVDGGMVAISGMDDEQLERLLQEIRSEGTVLVVAGINSAHQRVVSGHRKALDELARRIDGLTAKYSPLNVGAAFHSPCMTDAASQLKFILESIDYKAPSWPVLSNVTGRQHAGLGDTASMIELLTLQMTRPVQWVACMETMQAFGVKQTVELGPGSVLTRLWKSFQPETDSDYSDDPRLFAKEVEIVLPGTAKAQRDGAKIADFLPRCLGIAVSTRNNRFDSEAYRTGVLDPYRAIELLVAASRESGQLPSDDQLRQGWDMLHSVFETKGTTTSERMIRLTALINETGTEHLFAVPNPNDGGVAI
ncbi:ACP S-malonyltransferase [Cohnella mopanensis]|uniref:ACP S-malonyltransferase n=1 Tax=Cohnella mopanensis TaxID=2911966 RepID=UPI001EF904D6|nr:ACP S-malonyltransferase [Cohnella mopanensis]